VSVRVAKPYTWDEVERAFVRKAAWQVYRRYGQYGVALDDITQEINAWLWGDGKAKVEKWLGMEPQRTTRIFRSMLDVSQSYAEHEKSLAVGYEEDDVYWYTPGVVEILLPYAVKADWNGESEQNQTNSRSSKPLHERGDFLAMVMDVRRALKAGYSPSDVRGITDFLGGQRPTIGARKVVSNAAAQAITESAA